MRVLALTAEAFSDVAGGVESVLTGVALIIAGVWAYLRFRRTPESRPKVKVDLSASWRCLGDSHYVLANLTATNDGGRRWKVLWGVAADDLSRLGIYVLGSNDRLEVGSSGVAVGWADLRAPEDSAQLLEEDQTLRPADVVNREVLFRLPDDAVAVLVTALLHVRLSRGRRVPIEAFAIATLPSVNEEAT
jgi:hypothetical protein